MSEDGQTVAPYAVNPFVVRFAVTCLARWHCARVALEMEGDFAWASYFFRG